MRSRSDWSFLIVMRHDKHAIRALAFACGLAIAAAPPRQSPPVKPKSSATTAPSNILVIYNLPEVALGQPQVRVQIMQGDRIVTGEPPRLLTLEERVPVRAAGQLNRDISFLAFLDTG